MSPTFFYLVAVVFDQQKDKSSIHEGKQVIEEERQADVDFFCLLYLLKKQKQNSKYNRINLQLH